MSSPRSAGSEGALAVLRDAFAGPDAPPEGSRLVVAVSGGRDSVTLLHLLRFGAGLPDVALVAAHLDHAMRPDSGGDAAWVRGLCRAWGVPCRTARLDRAPSDEAGARRARYAFLEEVRAGEGADAVLTAHHADDQAETVLFRAARGTGPGGLAGILPRREPAVWRPLLQADRADLRAWARAHGVRWRTDPTNRAPRPRNVLRHEILPRLEEAVAPGTTRALAGLARRAREDEAAWAAALPTLLAPLEPRRADGEVSVLRAALLERPEALRTRLVRALAEELGTPLTEAGTRAAIAFIRSGTSGGGVELGGGRVLRRELDRIVLGRPRTPAPDRSLDIPGPGPGRGEALLGGRAWRVVWDGGGEVPAASGPRAAFGLHGLHFPLRVRGWAPGDRIRLSCGHKKLKKVFLEGRVPSRLRGSRPVVVDAAGSVLWVPGLARSTLAPGAAGGPLLHMECTDDDTDG